MVVHFSSLIMQLPVATDVAITKYRLYDYFSEFSFCSLIAKTKWALI